MNIIFRNMASAGATKLLEESWNLWACIRGVLLRMEMVRVTQRLVLESGTVHAARSRLEVQPKSDTVRQSIVY